jgi:hypothetical protein
MGESKSIKWKRIKAQACPTYKNLEKKEDAHIVTLLTLSSSYCPRRLPRVVNYRKFIHDSSEIQI